MHFEVLIEDLSGKKTLDLLMPKIIGDQHTFRVISYRGVGRIPKNLMSPTDASQRILLNRLPSLLRGYGNTYANSPARHSTVLLVVCDLDNKCLKTFRQALLDVLNSCNPRLQTRFCIAIEEGEAWLLGDISAIKAAYPQAKANILNNYQNDSICNTWELLAEAVFIGGLRALEKKGTQAIGIEKSAWAEKITPYMNVDKNTSPSFCYFRDKIRELI